MVTIGLKFGAYWLTDSVGLLSDATESAVNLVAALTALLAIWYAAQPVDRSHNYGHEKIEYFASAVEGGLILFAAAGIAWFAIRRLVDPQPLESIGIGIVVSLIATGINLVVARALLRVAAAHNSVVLDADGRHLMTDVWTSLGVMLGLLLVRLSGIERLDPIIALLVCLNIVRTGFDLLRTSFHGLMDRALPAAEQTQVRVAIEGQLPQGVAYHALRTRQAGSRRFVDLHLLVPGATSVSDAHELANQIERSVAGSVPFTETTVHLEPMEAPEAWRDSALLSLEQSAALEEPEVPPPHL